VVAEAVVDEPVEQLQKEVPPEGGAGGRDAHAVVEDAGEHGPADLVVVAVAEADAGRVSAEGHAAAAARAILTVGDVEVGDATGFAGAAPGLEDLLAPPEPTAARARGFAGCAADR
jgi:hypothetical protein